MIIAKIGETALKYQETGNDVQLMKSKDHETTSRNWQRVK